MGFRSFRLIGSSSRRNIVSSENNNYQKNIESKRMLYPNHRARGRNNSGVITCRHLGGGHKRMFRKVDFFRKKLGSVGCVRSFVFDPNRKVHLALVFYDDGEKTYILAPKSLYIGQYIVTGFCIPIEVGNSLPIWKFPIGTTVHSVEIKPGQGGQLSRSAGTGVQLVACNDGFVRIRLPSGDSRFARAICWSTRGQVGNRYKTPKDKAGNTRWLGLRPTVRGSAINPVDHPHGGGEGRCPIGRPNPITPWGFSRLGVKTRHRKGYQVLKDILKLLFLYYSICIMARSLKKGPFVSNHLLEKIENTKSVNSETVIITWARNSTIVPIMIARTISVYNGREHLPIFITDQIVGHKLGEFAPTRTFRGHSASDKKAKRLLYSLYMGQKTHLVGIRLGINRRSCSYWYGEGAKYTFFVEEDRNIRRYVFQTLSEYIVSQVDIERRGSGIRLRISTAKAGGNIGSIERLLENWCSELQMKCSSVRSDYFWNFSSLKTLTDVVKEPDICVFVRQLTCPESNAHFLANFLVAELEKRTPFRRALRMVQERRQNIGQVRGFRVQVSGRLNGVEIARMEWSRVGRVPLHTLVADLDYSCKTARTIYGLIGVKTWVFKPKKGKSFYFTVLKLSYNFYDAAKA